ncbi:MAG: hypothetical protein PHU08_07220, partial [Dehalococcoidales bacterium]|nr:hypothetical protein [Dehalococcoidales bacterium]
LFEGINDSREQVASLARLLAGLNLHVNLILANQPWQSQFQPPAPAAVLAFQEELRRWGVKCTLRRSKGLDINAGCGQLRSRLLASAGK